MVDKQIEEIADGVEFELCAKCDTEMPSALLQYCPDCREYYCGLCCDEIVTEVSGVDYKAIFCPVCGEKIW